MSDSAASRIERTLMDTTGSLKPASLWLVATCVPDNKTPLNFDAESPSYYQNWLRQEVGNWPAPLKVGDHLREPPRDNGLVFSPPPEGSPGPAHYVELLPDGSSVIAVQVGNLKETGVGQGAIWAIGEGSVAWLTICFVRFAAAWASQAGAQGSATIDLRLLSSMPSEDQTMLQLWNFASGTNAPSSDVRLMTRPSLRSFELAAGCTGEVALIARSLLLPLLAQFGLADSRHIDANGVIVSTNFVGHAPQIVAWAQAIGASFRSDEASHAPSI